MANPHVVFNSSEQSYENYLSNNFYIKLFYGIAVLDGSLSGVNDLKDIVFIFLVYEISKFSV